MNNLRDIFEKRILHAIKAANFVVQQEKESGREISWEQHDQQSLPLILVTPINHRMYVDLLHLCLTDCFGVNSNCWDCDLSYWGNILFFSPFPGIH